jgi:hypothetical protein
MIARLLKYFSYYKIDYGFTCGRHWIMIDGKGIAQTPGDAVWLRDEDVHRLGYIVIDGCCWGEPFEWEKYVNAKNARRNKMHGN